MNINPIDVIIVLAVLVAIVNGYRRGFWLSLYQYSGMLLGVLAGAAVAPSVANFLRLTGPSRGLGAALTVVVAGMLGSTLGYWLGQPIRVLLLSRPGRGHVDSFFGGVFSAIAVLAVSWFLGQSFDRGPSQDLARAIQRSTILRALDAIAPRPPGFLTRVETILAGVPFPRTFSTFEPLLPEPALPLPNSADTPGIRAAAAATVKVFGHGCGGIVSGSGFPVGPGQVITNAHVVAGTTGTQIRTLDQQTLRATVVLFDPERDIAILTVPSLRFGALTAADAGRGTYGAAIGYPGGGPERVSPAVVNGSVIAEGRDIYGRNLVRREIWITQAVVEPGDSGGPLVDRGGNVLGVIFAASTSQPGQAYALTDAEASADIEQARGRTQPVPVGSCAL